MLLSRQLAGAGNDSDSLRRVKSVAEASKFRACAQRRSKDVAVETQGTEQRKKGLGETQTLVCKHNGFPIGITHDEFQTLADDNARLALRQFLFKLLTIGSNLQTDR